MSDYMEETEKVIQFQVDEEGIYLLTDAGNLFWKWFDEEGSHLKRVVSGPFQ